MKLKTPYIILLLFFVALGVYYPAIFAPLNSVDDPTMITRIINSDGINLKRIFFPGGGYYYRPLLGLTFRVDNYLWAMEASFLHLENILLHSMNVVTVFLIARHIFRRYDIESAIAPFSAALLFALHPINTEPVNWISGRTDLLAGFFILFSILFLLKSLASGSSLLCLAASLSFLLACFSKEVAVFYFPAAVFLIYCFDYSKNDTFFHSLLACVKNRYAFLLSFSTATAIYFGIRHFALMKDRGIATAAGGIVGEKSSDIFYTLRTFTKLLGFYGKKLFFPWPLNFAIVRISDYYILIGLLLLAVCLYLVYKRNLIAALFITSACIILPAFLVAVSRMAWTPIAERYLYIPSATFSIAVTLIAYMLFRGLKAEKVLVVVAVLLFSTVSYATVQRNMQWQDNLTLFSDTVKKSPDYPPAKNELAIALKQQGRHKEGNQLINMNAAGSNDINREFYELNKANLLVRSGDLEGARQLVLKNADPSRKKYTFMLQQLVIIDEKRLEAEYDKRAAQIIREEIIELLTKLLARTRDPFYHYRLGQYYLSMGDKGNAQLHFAMAYQNAPDDIYYKIPAGKLAEKLSKK